MTANTRRSAEATSPAPDDVARRWVASMQEHDLATVRDLYEVGAALHVDETVLLGPEAIVEHLRSAADLRDGEPDTQVGGQGVVTLVWPDAPEGNGDSSRLRVRHGKIVEQWIGERTFTRSGLSAVPLTMSTSGAVSPEDHDLVWDMVDGLLRRRDESTHHIDVRMRSRDGSSRPDAVSLRITIELTGGSVRASTEQSDVRSAVQVVERRLRQALTRRADRRSDTRGDDSIRLSPDVAAAAATHHRPPESREIVRHKSVSPGASTFEEATFDLVSMGYDFFLYVDVETDNDALVARAEDGSFRELLDPPTSTIAEARSLLDMGSEPFVFFHDESAGRGRVLYRRLDGHYGLIVPADESADA